MSGQQSVADFLHLELPRLDPGFRFAPLPDHLKAHLIFEALEARSTLLALSYSPVQGPPSLELHESLGEVSSNPGQGREPQ